MANLIEIPWKKNQLGFWADSTRSDSVANYRSERDAMLRRWHGEIARPGRRKSTSWPNPIVRDDYIGIPTPANSPFASLLLGDCLVWLHSLNSGGYGTLTIDGEPLLAHRVAYTQAVGEISSGKQINHLCDRPYCVQPAHIYPGDHQDNADDARLFALYSMLSPADRIQITPDAEYQDSLLKRLQASERFEFVQPWESPTKPAQTLLDEFECPEHDFRIPAGETARVCRICDRFEHDDEFTSNFHIAAIGREIYPVSQLIDSIYDEVVSLELGQDDWKGWRERCCYRGSILVLGDSHVLRNCMCYLCQSDRVTFREHLDRSLTPEEAAILDICDRMEPLIRQHIEQMRRDVFEWMLPHIYQHLTDDQKSLFLDHLDECTLTEVRSAAHHAEVLLGYFIHTVTTYNSLEEFFERDRLYKHWLRAVIPVPDDPEVGELCMSSASATGKKIIELLDAVVADFEFPRETMLRSDIQKLRIMTQVLLNTILCDVVTYDLYGRTSRSREYPYPHESCVQEILFPIPSDEIQLA